MKNLYILFFSFFTVLTPSLNALACGNASVAIETMGVTFDEMAGEHVLDSVREISELGPVRWLPRGR